MNKPHPVRGYAFIAAATLLWGIAATLGRAAFTGRLLPSGQALEPIDPVILSQSRVTISFLVLLPVLMLRRGWRNLKVPAADFGRIVLIGVLGMAASNYLYYLAIKRTNVATQQLHGVRLSPEGLHKPVLEPSAACFPLSRRNQHVK